MRVFVSKWFARFARSEGIGDDGLCEAVHRAQRGLIDADLRRGLIKQRVARPGQGRRGGFRVLVAYRAGERAVFLYGFAKSERDNVSPQQLSEWQGRAHDVLTASHDAIERLVVDDELREVYCD
jgi:hypothetical protein